MKRGTLEQISNLATWKDTLEFLDDETGEAAFEEADDDTHPEEITLSIRDPVSGETVLSGSLTGDDLVITGDGVVEFTFTAAAMSALEAKTYQVGVLYEQEDETTQVILGTISILEGL